jgi:hypothetical protein
MVLPVRVWGTEVHGKPFNLLGYTIDISAGGARLAGVAAELRLDDVIAVQYKQQKAKFRVTWIGAPDTPKAKQFGIEYVAGEKFIWMDLPSEEFFDGFTGFKIEPEPLTFPLQRLLSLLSLGDICVDQ